MVSGFSEIGMLPMNCAQVPPPGQSVVVEQVAPLLVPLKHLLTPSVAAGTGQSLVKPFGFLLVHASPPLGLPSHTPMHGLAGDPLHGLPLVDPIRQIGQGWVGFEVRIVLELSSKSRLATPLEVLRVPATGCEKVFSTHTESPAFEIGSGVPKRHPVVVHS